MLNAHVKNICSLCGDESSIISSHLGICVNCIKENFSLAKPYIEAAHRESRARFNLPDKPPRSIQGIKCTHCGNECSIAEGERGFCGLKENHGGKLYHRAGMENRGLLDWYHDPLPTNCVADWICPAGSISGYPRFSYSKGPEYGYKNLAVFYKSCTFNCLYCQNWHFRQHIDSSHFLSARQLANAVDEQTACICYFGGDPGSQIMHAVKASEIALKETDNKILRICWETNGNISQGWLKKMAHISFNSGGCIKFDLKAWNEKLHIALTGSSNRRTMENFRYLAQMAKDRPDPPFLVASTLLVPGYIDAGEVKSIAEFISNCWNDIPYSLLAFYPHFYMQDLPTTSSELAYECAEAAKSAGLSRVKIGNIHLLS
jgi:pyruvate formate lyase activating enzyme